MSSATAFRLFGKLPSRPDFVQLGASSAAFTRFDDWLTDSVEWAHARTGAAWREAFSGDRSRAFVFVTGSDASSLSVIAGALAPSSDEAGRQFPLAIASGRELDPAFGREPQLLPLICEGIWQEASQRLAELLAGSYHEPLSRITEVPVHLEMGFGDAELAYSEWSEALPLLELWTLISASASLDALRGTLRWLYETVRPHRHREPPSTRLALRLPLGAAGGAAVCFWLDVVRRLSAWRKTAPTFFWSHDGGEGQLTVHLGAPAAWSVSELWLPTRTRDEVCDLTEPVSNAELQRSLPLPASVEQALSRPCSVANFLAALSA